MHARLIHSDTGRSRALHPQHALEMDDQWGVDRVNVAQASLYLQGATLKFQPKNGGGGPALQVAGGGADLRLPVASRTRRTQRRVMFWY